MYPQVLINTSQHPDSWQLPVIKKDLLLSFSFVHVVHVACIENVSRVLDDIREHHDVKINDMSFYTT